MEFNRRAQGQAVVDRLHRRSTWVFVLLALLSVVSYFLLASETSDERASAAEINFAGKRRMLSQRIAYLASQARYQPAPETDRLLANDLNQLETTHRILLTGDPEHGIRPPQAARLRAGYSGPDGLDAAVRHFIERGRALLATPPGSEARHRAASEVMQLAQGDLIVALDRMVGEYQAVSEHGTDTLRLLQWLALMTTLALLAYSAQGLLRPLIAEVRTTFNELEESEAALQRAGDENRLILASAGDGIFGVDREGRITFTNPAAAAMLGTGVEALTGRRHHPYVLPSADNCPICRLIEHGGPPEFREGEFARRPANGVGQELFPVEFSVAPRPDGEGAVVSFRDISERRRSELTLQRFQQRLVDAIESMDDAFALFDADDRLALYNLHFVELFAVAGDVIRIGMPFSELVAEVARQQFYAIPSDDTERWLAERIEAHRRAEGSSELPMSNGRWLRVTERRTREGSTVVIWSDVSHLKQALITADHASRAKSEFLARMSHELRTPLNAILGFAQVLDKSGGPLLATAQRECVTHILSGGHHLLGLINEVLDLSAIEAGRLQVDIEEVALTPLIRECLTLVSPQATDRQVEVVTGDAGDTAVRADRTRLKQVLLNLLSNGIKYNRPGGRLTLEIAELEDRLRLTVSDTGRGIPADLAARVFEPFDRLGAKQVEGTGIGLAITRRMVELMGGRIDFTSTPGVGTRFNVDLVKAGSDHPAAGAALAALADAGPESPAGDTPPAPDLPKDMSPAAACTLLGVGLAPGEVDLMRLVTATLRDTVLIVADDADDAGRQLASGQIQAIIADAAHLPAIERFGTDMKPLVVLGDRTASDDDENAGRRWMRKPLKPREMARLLREMLQ